MYLILIKSAGVRGYVNVDSLAGMEANAQGETNASAAKDIMEICAPKLSASPAVEHTGPAWSPTGASVGKAGTDVTAIRDFAEEFLTASGSLHPNTSLRLWRRRRKRLKPVSRLKPTMWFKPQDFGPRHLHFNIAFPQNKAFILLFRSSSGHSQAGLAAFSEQDLFL